MYKKVQSFMKQYHMVEEGDSILAAVSGGADSMCLLRILMDYQQEKPFALGVVHVEHGIRGEESMQDARFVENFCKWNKIPCFVYHCKAEEYAREHGLTPEEGARKLRYGYFQEAAEQFGADKVAVAHNQNDCAETMLFHLARGTGLKGLCGILPVRDQIIRPLLCVTRSEIEAWMASRKQEYCMDSTNESLVYSRNRIRHQVLAVLTEMNPQAVPHMAQTAQRNIQVMELLKELTQAAAEKYVKKDEKGIYISAGVLQERPLIQTELLLQALTEAAGSSRDISDIHVEKLQQLLEKQVGKMVNLPYSIKAERTYEGIRLMRIKQKADTWDQTKGEAERQLERKAEKQSEGEVEKQSGQSEAQQSIWTLLPGQTLEIPSCNYRIQARLLEEIPQNREIPKKIYTKWFDYDKIKGSMQLRKRREKDFFVINAEGARKKLRKYLIDEKIPKEERDQLLLLADEEHIIWVIGYRISEDVKVTEHTRRILEIQVDGGEKNE